MHYFFVCNLFKLNWRNTKDVCTKHDCLYIFFNPFYCFFLAFWVLFFLFLRECIGLWLAGRDKCESLSIHSTDVAVMPRLWKPCSLCLKVEDFTFDIFRIDPQQYSLHLGWLEEAVIEQWLCRYLCLYWLDDRTDWGNRLVAYHVSSFQAALIRITPNKMPATRRHSLHATWFSICTHSSASKNK